MQTNSESLLAKKGLARYVGLLSLTLSSVIIGSASIISEEALIINIIISLMVCFATTCKQISKSVILLTTFTILYNALYLPFFGVFSEISGTSNPSAMRVALGLRSVIFSVGMCILLMRILFSQTSTHGPNKVIYLIFLLLLSFGFVKDGLNNLSEKMTYLINSLIPLMGLLVITQNLEKLKDTPENYRQASLQLLLCILLICALYFPFLPHLYEYFRPDLASVLRIGNSRIFYGEFDPSWMTEISGIPLARFVGTFPDPIIFGYFCSISVLLGLAFRYHFLTICSFLLLAISLSKGAWLFTLQTLLLWYAFRRGKQTFFFIFIISLCIQLLLAGVIQSSNKMHFLGLIGGLSSLYKPIGLHTLLGHGIGSGGNLARIGSSETYYLWNAVLTGAESAIGTLAYQLGLIGICICFFLYISALFGTLTFEYNHSKRLLAPGLISGLVSSLLINSFLQENCINSSVTSIVMLAISVLAYVRPKNETNVKSRY